MPYDNVEEPTEDERDRIYVLFKRLIEQCYPNCRYISDSCDDDNPLKLKFFSEINTVTEDGEEDNKDRVAAIHGGLDTDHDDLHLLIDIGKWRASTYERNLVILIHEVSHLETPEHDWHFWLDFINNFETFSQSISEICDGYSDPCLNELRKEAVHHVNKYTVSSDEKWWVVRRDLAELIEYPLNQYDLFEHWSEPVTDKSVLDEFRQQHELESHLESEHTYLQTLPVRDEQLSNMELSPKYIEQPDLSDEDILKRLAYWLETGIPLLPPPVIEPDSNGAYRILEGEITVAVAQRVGLSEIDVINKSRECISIDELKPRSDDISDLELL